jgi:hypothetical protein
VIRIDGIGLSGPAPGACGYSGSSLTFLSVHPATAIWRSVYFRRMRKDVRELIRRLEAVGMTVEPTPGHYRVLRDGNPLRKANGMPFMLPFSPDTIRWRRAAVAELRKLGIDV